ncbi:hypothetical protein J7T55_012692 [Diaporthe amygdali]|uniref:uncharacterized protein n=1 Tax=Phomopsis amygdali TaxID=1214568 RepID=UPI0022FEE3B9|nr:uncharacterized protein J7T55_012692 [Diaporthe amygdali]KAJ0115413.1 hypothetical protein J7T55_012692 [Diaporthe amygdali]
MYRHACSGAIVALATVFLGSAYADPTYEFAYCASSNTATTSATTSIYQSQGLCYGTCNDEGYAFAVLQDSDCWCSNTVPSSDDQVSTSNCETSCPGYPSDYCGGDGTYGYIALSASPSSTAGEYISVFHFAYQCQVFYNFHVYYVYYRFRDQFNNIQNHHVERENYQRRNTNNHYSSPNAAQSDSSGLGKGAVAGLTVGILAAVAAFIFGAFMFRRHKRKLREEEEPMTAASMAHRRGSSAGIMSKTGTMSSIGYGMTMDEEGSYSSPSRRLSMKPLDPRLDPKVGLYRTASHDSFNTIRDDQDYSRRVHQPPRAFRVTNPDPEDD